MVQSIPDGYHSVAPYLIYKDARAALDFYKKAFNARQTMQLNGPGGSIGHAEVLIGNSHVMMAEEFPDMGALSAETIGGSPVSLMIYVEDVDAMFAQAIKAGAEELRPVQDQFYGDRSGTLKDPFGYQWTISTHVEDVPQELAQQRFDEMMKGE